MADLREQDLALKTTIADTDWMRLVTPTGNHRMTVGQFKDLIGYTALQQRTQDLEENVDELIDDVNGVNTQVAERIKKTGDVFDGVFRVNTRALNVFNLSVPGGVSTLKIKTKIPESINTGYTLILNGRSHLNATPIMINLSFQTGYSSTIIAYGYCSASSFKPEMKLAIENGFVVVVMGGSFGYGQLTIDAITNTSGTNLSYFENWEWANEDVSSGATATATVPLKE